MSRSGEVASRSHKRTTPTTPSDPGWLRTAEKKENSDVARDFLIFERIWYVFYWEYKPVIQSPQTLFDVKISCAGLRNGKDARIRVRVG